MQIFRLSTARVKIHQISHVIFQTKSQFFFQSFFGFCAFGFEDITHPSCDLTSIVDKTHHGPVIVFFLCNFGSLFSYVGGVLDLQSKSIYWFLYDGNFGV